MRSWLPIWIASFAIYGCENDLERVREVTTKPDGPFQSSFESAITYSKRGELQLELSAPQMDQYMVDEKVEMDMPKGLKIVFYDTTSSEQSVLTAQKGRYYNATNKLVVQQDVVFVNGNGETLNTEELIWLQDSSKVYTDKRVKITQEDAIIYGKGLNATEDFSKYTIRQITGELYIENPDTTQ